MEHGLHLFNVNSGCNSAASPPKTKEVRANIKNRIAIFEICPHHKSFSLPQTADILTKH
jgi:hypothetical protein